MAFKKNVWQGSKFEEKLNKEEEARRLDDLGIHNPLVTPTAMFYGGHLVFRIGGGLATWNIVSTFTDTEVTRANVVSTTSNVDITDYIGAQNRKVNGALVGVSIAMSVAGTKVKSTTYALVYARYSTIYDTIPLSSNYLSFEFMKSQSQDADNIELRIGKIIQAACPVVYQEGKSFIVWNTTSTFVAMVNANNTYFTNIRLYLLGYYL